MDDYQLNTGTHIPSIGFGTWEITPDDNAYKAVRQALEAGYRLIDTAHIYGNEQGVGQAIGDSGLARDDVFITTKLWNDDQGYDKTLRAFDVSLATLQLEYLDLYLIHWPATSQRHESWKAMQELLKAGKLKAIGVSNYTVDHLRQLMDRSEVLPAVNQVEFHPFIYEQQRELLEFCAQHQILIEAYSPISRLAHADQTAIDSVAKEVNKSPQQVVLRWCLQHHTIPLPRSTQADHMAANRDVFDFELTDTQMTQLNMMSDGERVTWDPAGMG